MNWKLLEKVLLIIAGMLVLVSLLFPYWRVDLKAGIYPKGLRLQIRPYRLEGDVIEIDKLNHYIGMRKLQSAGQLERKLAVPLILIAGLCLLALPYVPRKWSIWLAIPALVFPVAFVAELYWWLRDSGINLDPKAPLNHSIKPFIPEIYGEGKVGQFGANANFQIGFYMTLLAAVLLRIGLYLRSPKWLPKGIMIDASVLLLISLLFPYWRVDFEAGKYPRGLMLQVHPHRLEGNIMEINKLNRDIGMRDLESAGKFERSVAVPSIVIVALCLLMSAFIPWKWSIWLTIPSLIFPIVFVGELYWWLRDSGLNLSPDVSSSQLVTPFVPLVIGKTTVESVTTTATFQIGYYFTLLVALLVGVSMWAKKLQQNRLVKMMPLLFIFIFVPLTAPTAFASPQILNVNQSLTITEALRSAKDGDTIIVENGTYYERLIVDKAVTLIGQNGPVIDGGGQDNVVELIAPKIVLRGFTIRNSGYLLSQGDAGIVIRTAPHIIIENNRFEDVLYGVQVRNSSNVVIRDNTFYSRDLAVPQRGDLIRVWYSDDLLIECNRVHNGRDVVIWYSDNAMVRGNHIHNGRYGLHFMYCDETTVEDNHLIGNSVGVYLMYSHRLKIHKNWFINNHGASGYGVGLKDVRQVTVTENFMASNRSGIFMDYASGQFRKNLIAFNDTGIALLPSSRKNKFLSNSLIDNHQQVTVEGQGSSNNGNLWEGNYWSDYNGYDLDNDGLGDFPYQSIRLFEKLVEQHPELRLFKHSPSTQTLDFASHLFPIFAPRPRLTDFSPRMTPLIPALEAPSRGLSGTWILSSTGLILFSLWLVKSQEFSSFFREVCLFSNNGSGTQEEPNKTCLGTNGSNSTLQSTSQSVISVSNLTKHFGKVIAVQNLDFEVNRGETIALWGQNGAGKTTALRCMLGIYPFEGEISIHGKSAKSEGKLVRELIGYVPQEIRLHADLTVRETISFYGQLRMTLPNRVQDLIEEWQLSDMIDKSIEKLSGGMRQRLALAIALLSNPPVLVLDEPTSNLDVQTRHEFWIALDRLKKSGKTMIFCSHRTDEVMRLSDRVIVMKQGKKIAEGAPNQLNGYLPQNTILNLVVPELLREKAKNLLIQNGFSAVHNELRIAVEVAQNRKAEPFQILAEASIAVDDFELSERLSSPEGGG